MLKEMGHDFGNWGDLHHTWSSHKNYYLTESEQALHDLDLIRRERTVKKK